jgi:hypothetical protein
LNRPDKLRAGAAGAAGQRDAREEVGARGADVGVRADQLLLGRADIRTHRQQVGRQAGRQLGQFGLRQGAGRRQVLRQRLAHQQHQQVGVLRALAHLLRQHHARGIDQRHALLQVEFGDHAIVVLQLDQLLRLFAPGQGLAGQRQQLVVGQQRQVGVGDRRDQADMGRLARFLGGQELRQRRIAEVLHAAEQVQLERADAEAGRVGAGDAVVRSRQAAAGDRRIHGRQRIGAADLVLGARLFDVEDRHAQVAVVGQRQFDQLLQARIGEEALPGDLRGRFVAAGLASGKLAATGAAGRSYFGASDMQPDSARASGQRRARVNRFIIFFPQLRQGLLLHAHISCAGARCL